MKRVIKEKDLKKVCAVYQDDDFGLEVLQGGEHALKDLGMTYAEKTTYKRGATDFASQVAKMKEAGCDGVVMGTIIRETIGVIATGAQARLESGLRRHHGELFDIIHKLGGAAVNGFYSACTINYPYEDDQNREGRAVVRELQGQVQRGPDRALGLRLSAHQPVHRGGGEGRQGPQSRHAREGAVET